MCEIKFCNSYLVPEQETHRAMGETDAVARCDWVDYWAIVWLNISKGTALQNINSRETNFQAFPQCMLFYPQPLIVTNFDSTVAFLYS